ncbi:hypothetical protein KCU98_g262, partial [Aureobasidium melanogenum]
MQGRVDYASDQLDAIDLYSRGSENIRTSREQYKSDFDSFDFEQVMNARLFSFPKPNLCFTWLCTIGDYAGRLGGRANSPSLTAGAFLAASSSLRSTSWSSADSSSPYALLLRATNLLSVASAAFLRILRALRVVQQLLVG